MKFCLDALKMIFIYRLLLPFFLLVITYNVNAEENINELLLGNNWEKVDKAVSLIDREISAHNRTTQKKVVDILRDETEILKTMYDTGTRPKRYGSGPGELLGNIMFLVVKFDLPESIPVLIDWVNTSPAPRKTVAKYLSKEEPDDMKTFSIIDDRYHSELAFYKQRKAGLLRTVCKYLDIVKTASLQKRAIIKSMLLFQLEAKSHYHRISAIKCSKNFAGDKVVMNKVKIISTSDKYNRNRKGKILYSVREEAKKVLEQMKSSE